jgi:Ca2+-binding RTX toxin-like protein
MPADVPSLGAVLPAFSGVYVFGDSLVDPGNDLSAAELLNGLPFVVLPKGAPTADNGYFEGRFTDGYNFADLISNKLLHEPTAATFPYGFAESVLGLPIPFGNRPDGNNLSFAYGGALALPGADPPPGLSAQTDIYRNFTPDPNALYVITIGANDVRALVPKSGDPVVGDAADARLAAIASEITQEVAQLYARGARHVVVADIPEVGLTPDYAGSADEAARRSLVNGYAEKADTFLSADLGGLALPAGATLSDYDFLGYTNAVIANPAAYGFTNVTQARMTVQAGALEPVGSGFLFFDTIHPSAQAHAQIAAEILDSLEAPGAPPNWSVPPSIGSQAAGAIPVGGADRFAAALVAGGTYVVDLLGVSSGSGSLADPSLRVLDASGAVVAQDDDGGLGLDSHLQFVAPTTGDYAIEVAGVGVSGGTYRLQAGDSSGSNLLLSGLLRGSDVTVLGGPANDTIAAEARGNYLRGGDGNDSIAGGSAFDDINGNMGNDSLHGNAGDDWVVGGKDNDVQFGDAGNDIVWGNLGNDTLHGGDGADQVRGGQGDDSLTGGAGNDYVSGDRGNDTETGGAGADLFHTSQDAGIDKVLDFNLAEGDRVMLDPGTTYAVSQVGADTVIDFGAGSEMILVDVQLATLTPGWIFES